MKDSLTRERERHVPCNCSTQQHIHLTIKTPNNGEEQYVTKDQMNKETT